MNLPALRSRIFLLAWTSFVALGCGGSNVNRERSEGHPTTAVGPNGGRLIDVGAFHAELVELDNKWRFRFLDASARNEVRVGTRQLQAFAHSDDVDYPAVETVLRSVESNSGLGSDFDLIAPSELAGAPFTLVIPRIPIEGHVEHLHCVLRPTIAHAAEVTQ